MASATLVVDDDPTLGRALRDALAGYDVTVEIVEEPARAIELLDSHRFGGLVVDLAEHGHGLDVLRHAQQSEPPIPTVILTGRPPAELRSELHDERVKLICPETVDAHLLANVVLGLCGVAL